MLSIINTSNFPSRFSNGPAGNRSGVYNPSAARHSIAIATDSGKHIRAIVDPTTLVHPARRKVIDEAYISYQSSGLHEQHSYHQFGQDWNRLLMEPNASLATIDMAYR